jgi:hypothetical protein
MNQKDINKMLHDTNLSDETKALLDELIPLLEHLEKTTKDISSVIDISADTETIKNILMYDVIEGKSDQGLVGDISTIKTIISLSDKLKQERIHTFEDLLNSFKEDLNDRYDTLAKTIDNYKQEILDKINIKVPWYKTVSHVKDLILTISISTAVILNIMKLFGVF